MGVKWPFLSGTRIVHRMGGRVGARRRQTMMQDESSEPHCLKDPPKKISIVVPCYNEEGNIEPLFEAISRNLEGFHWEVILVDDGSSDATFRMIRALVAKTSRVRGIRFSRNFGHQYALLAGLSGSSGDVIVT